MNYKSHLHLERLKSMMRRNW